MHATRLRSVLLLLITVLPGIAGASEGAPVDAVVFYDPACKSWPQTEKILAEAARVYPRLRLKSRSLQEESARDERAYLAEKWNRKLLGDVTFSMGPFHLENTGEDKQIDTYLLPMLRRVFNPTEGKGRLPADARTFARKWFGQNCEVELITRDESAATRYFRVLRDGANAGIVADVFGEIRCPMCNDTQFLVAISAAEKPDVLAIEPVREVERWGRRLDQLEAERFLKNVQKPDAKADAITGTTKTFDMYRALVDDVVKRAPKAP